MKTWLYSFIAILMRIGCSKEDGTEIVLGNNAFMAQRNDQSWSGTTEIRLTAHDTLVFLGIGKGLDNGVAVVKV